MVEPIPFISSLATCPKVIGVWSLRDTLGW
jgi:hypothetical protein